ncbi:hypothetical protein [Candidatus Nasuia deltocephalinicola]|uniref:hypothetical protein n=1 Tax=Candidatus Nasuia deltocephalincola TaxID=1160784 RepID=UPI00216AC63F|nr:hypothetical protein [Candidatus Nasuia deltocephalinicola]
MNIFLLKKSFYFKKFFFFYNYKIYLYLSNKNIYCNLFSFFSYNIILSLSTINIKLKNYILINFGKSVNNIFIFEFLAKVFSHYVLGMNVYNLSFKFSKKLKYSKKINSFYFFLKKYLFLK